MADSPASTPSAANYLNRWREKYFPLLQMMARQIRLDPKVQARVGESDVLSTANQHALEALSQFRGSSEGEFVRWLQEVFRTTYIDMMRAQFVDKRNPEAELAIHRSSVLLADQVVDPSVSPSKKAERHEVLLRFAEAVAALPPDQRDVVLLRDSQNLPIEEIAQRLGKTKGAVAGLLARGRIALRAAFRDYQEG
jgi:RNA polymerase sigma-70 factor (ECF subfamily)